jgi:hypothetical protein
MCDILSTYKGRCLRSKHQHICVSKILMVYGISKSVENGDERSLKAQLFIGLYSFVP